ncbi:MAG: PQQ-dependent sugar dehydrogenase [Oligoflexales bacterium]|nr:PQQ-dependent sugar dehydrogenase [Oligoflexales bacterium]
MQTVPQILLNRFVFIIAMASCQSPSTPEIVSSSKKQTVDPTLTNIGLETVVSGLTKPLAIVHANDERLFIVEQAGKILVFENGALRATPFLDIRDRVGSSGNEQGLLGLAFHPEYKVGESSKPHFWVNYTDKQGNTRISRFSVSSNDQNIADPTSEINYLKINQPFANHNGGVILFGPDGHLYVGTGDGGSANDPQGNGQNLNTLLGKILRLDVDSQADKYSIPTDNPFINKANHKPEIWSYGLRNPWRMSFDRSTGDLYIADVGQNKFEEINFQSATSKGGENYGWKIVEGPECFMNPNCNKANLVPPIAFYDRRGGCSVTGGYVYRGTELTNLNGSYFYGDFCQGTIWQLKKVSGRWRSSIALQNAGQISSFGEDHKGELYLSDFGSGSIFKIIQNAN